MPPCYLRQHHWGNYPQHSTSKHWVSWPICFGRCSLEAHPHRLQNCFLRHMPCLGTPSPPHLYSLVDPDGLSAFTACCLIALDKCPGVHPIGVAEVVCRLLGKAILSVAGTDVQHAAGAIQLCAGDAPQGNLPARREPQAGSQPCHCSTMALTSIREHSEMHCH